jgi:hypothetical protein
VETFLDKIEAAGVDIDNYFEIIEDNFNFIGIG